MKVSRFRSLIVVSLIVISSLTIGSCSKKINEPETISLKIGYLPIAAELPLYVAIEQGYFKEAGFEFELVKFTSSNELGNAASAGKIDLMAGTASNVVFDISSISKKHHQLIAMNLYSGREGHITDYLIVKEGSGITQLSDLVGKKIASFPGSVNKIFVNLVLEKHGLSRDQYDYIEMPPPNWQPALAAGAVDAVSALEPSATQIMKDGVGTSIFAGFYADLMADVPLSGHWLSSSFIESSGKEQADKVLEIYKKALGFIKSNNELSRSYLAKYANVRADIVDKVGLNPWVSVNDIQQSYLQNYIDLLFENGALKSQVEASSFLNLGSDAVE